MEREHMQNTKSASHVVHIKLDYCTDITKWFNPLMKNVEGLGELNLIHLVDIFVLLEYCDIKYFFIPGTSTNLYRRNSPEAEQLIFYSRNPAPEAKS